MKNYDFLLLEREHGHLDELMRRLSECEFVHENGGLCVPSGPSQSEYMGSSERKANKRKRSKKKINKEKQQL